MNTYIALLRGINVGGHNKLPMGELTEILEGLGLQDVETYIQSGNVVFQKDDVNPSELSERIKSAINERRGFAPQVLVLSAEELEGAVEANPFPEAVDEPKRLHFYFLADAPENPDLETLENVKVESERFALEGRVFYLHAPDGIGRSKLAARVEKALGVAATARNWRSVRKIKEMAARD